MVKSAYLISNYTQKMCEMDDKYAQFAYLISNYTQKMCEMDDKYAQSASDRADLVAPATGHPDIIRCSKGQIVSVPGFVK